MLMIGAAGRNAGKTEFACGVVRAFAGRIDLVGLKVTTIRERHGTCPRGGEGCGACALDGRYDIAEETDGASSKDTSRLLAAGARRVFWLRVLRPHLAEGMQALLDRVGRDTVIVGESNSLRTVVKPGLFLLLRDSASTATKESAAAVEAYADRTVRFDGAGFDTRVEDIDLVDREWVLREEATTKPRRETAI